MSMNMEEIKEKNWNKSTGRIRELKSRIIRAALYTTIIAGNLTSVLSANAAQELSLSGSEKLRAQVSSSKINRITFGSGHFSRIVGDSSKYHVIIDELGANLFLTSKVPAGGEFEISIINASGLVADLVLDVKDLPGQIINIHDEPAYNTNAGKNNSKAEVANLLKSMIKDEAGKYYVKALKRPLKANNPKLDNTASIVQDRTYRYAGLTGARLVVTNLKGGGRVSAFMTSNRNSRSEENITELKEEDFRSIFERVLAVSISNKDLAKNKSSYVWVITKDEDVR